ncbi:spermidine acetyltransferase [Aeromonas piscicola]|jgi:diamine N-acetyltransferase|uniref:spermidine N1-acetyltransferase n=1 Tax=Aeromonas TaxID=642 RepID=UPI0005B4DE39|nr:MULTISPECIES: spermidine N1-acetyltransferase [Aeromonas]MCW0503936.1 spermidine N1-acetyltransferase [Aeromonas piscicola]MCX7131801.1 spermidine N1-acetyltransferase [Aeromonas sp.]OCA65136.1 spermidine acetyltransferase [Aeromonas piscicola]
MSCHDTLSLRPLEREDLKFVHQLNNNASIMRYWFEEPYEAYMELAQLYDKHIHDQHERRFILEVAGTQVGLVELVDIRSIHRRAEFQIIIAPAYQGLGYAKTATLKGMKYAFNVLNLHKLYLIVDRDNAKAIHVYQGLGFAPEGELKEEFFIDGKYRTAIRMCLFQRDFQADDANRD